MKLSEVAGADGFTTGAALLDREEAVLAGYAQRTRASRGRQYPEPAHAYRTLYQRDRDRIVHSAAFRRLMYKTQVFVNQESDHHRTRLTHTLEVVQIARTLARALAANEDLVEAIGLAHDVGHPPFGHAGEEALTAAMAGHGGFEHNRHGLRVVSRLERRYPDFPGLNLTWEVREAFAQHSSQKEAPEWEEFDLSLRPLVEAQLVDAADAIAYNAHDLDDALSARLISLEELAEVPLWERAVRENRARHRLLSGVDLSRAAVRLLIEWQVGDLLATTRQRLEALGIETVEQVRSCREPLVGLSEELASERGELERFLQAKVYRHYRVARMTAKARRIVSELFAEFCGRPEQLPPQFYERCATDGVERSVCDYLAGMTDRYAQEEHLKLFTPFERV